MAIKKDRIVCACVITLGASIMNLRCGMQGDDFEGFGYFNFYFTAVGSNNEHTAAIFWEQSGWRAETEVWRADSTLEFQLLYTIPAGEPNFYIDQSLDRRIGTYRYLLRLKAGDHSSQFSDTLTITFGRTFKWINSFPVDMTFRSAVLSPENRSLFVFAGERIKKYDIASGLFITDINAPYCVSSALLMNGNQMLTVTEESKVRWLKLWDAHSGVLLRAVAIDDTAASKNSMNIMALAPSETVAATTGPEHAIQLWSVPDLTLVSTIPDVGPYIDRMMFSPDNSMLLVTWIVNNNLNTFDVSTGRLVRTIAAVENSKAAFSKDGAALVTSSGSEINVWQYPSMDLKRTISFPALSVETGSNDRIFGCNSAGVNLWSGTDPAYFRLLPARIQRFSTSPDGNRFALTYERLVSVWGLEDIEAWQRMP